MADFKTTYEKFILPFEGGYANIESDKGGETYAGISRNKFPQWEGWRFIDSVKQANASVGRPIARNTIFPELAAKVEAFYYARWLNYRLPEIRNQNLASLLFDFIVHSGSTKAISALQQIVGVNADGIIGAKTINATNSANQYKVFSRLLNERERFLKYLVASDPTQKVFESGWMNRIKTFRKLLPPTATGGIVVAAVLFTLIYLSA